MARLLRKPKKVKASSSELAGKALTKLRLEGSLTIPKAAEFLQLHKVTVREFVQKGFIESFRVGSRDRIDEMELIRIKNLLREHGSLAKAMKATQEQGDA